MAIGQDNQDKNRGIDYTWYDYAERSSDAKYPSWVDAAPNLQTYLNAINKSQPIIQCQYELVWSRWPRAQFFAKGIIIPGVSVNTLDLNHAGFTIKIPTHVTYETTDITLNIIADKEGFHYYDLRNMVLQTGHPLVAGDPRSTIGNPYGISPDEDTIEVRLRNSPDWDKTHHHWIIHNFKPIGIGDIELTQDGSSFVEFELKGTFTHITYDCGATLPLEEATSPSQAEEEPQETQPQVNQALEDTQNDTSGEDEGEEEEEPEEQEPEDLRPPEPINESVDIMSGSRTSISNDNCKVFISITSDVKFDRGEDGTPVTEEEIEAAKECSKKMTEASDELKAEMERISQMPADPNFNPEDGQVSDKDLTKTKTPTQEQIDAEPDESGSKKGDKVVSQVQTDCQFKSQAQVDAYNAAMEKYNNKVSQAQSDYKNNKPDPTKQS